MALAEGAGLASGMPPAEKLNTGPLLGVLAPALAEKLKPELALATGAEATPEKLNPPVAAEVAAFNKTKDTCCRANLVVPD